MRADRVQELRADFGLERRGAFFDQAQPEMDVAEQAALVRRPEDGPACQLNGPADVVEKGCGDACPVLPGKRYLDWNLQDPIGMPIEVVRQIRDRIAGLVAELD